MATDLVGVAAVIGSVATLVSTVGLTVRSFLPEHDHRRDDDFGDLDGLDESELLQQLERRRRRKNRPASRNEKDDNNGAFLAWVSSLLPRRKAPA